MSTNIMDIFQPKLKAKNTISSTDSVYDYSIIDSNGNEIPMEKLRSKVLLIVNVASRDPDALSIFKKLYTINGNFKHRGILHFNFSK